MAAVVVVGSLNLDIVVPVGRIAAPGETVLGGDSFRNPGGKGANQAVAAARLGQEVAMVGRVGDDDAGRLLRGALEGDRVDVGCVLATEGAPTGVALIAVRDDGENAIVVSPGANLRLSPDDIGRCRDLIAHADVVLLQLEIPLETVAAAAAAARGRVLLNPAPARALPPELLPRVEVLVPNRGELGALLGTTAPSTIDEVVDTARALKGPSAVVVTLGDQGAVVVSPDRVAHVPAPRVAATDTTAAGDCFCGALADALVRGASLEEAARWAVRAAAAAVTRSGAQASLPTREKVEAIP